MSFWTAECLVNNLTDDSEPCFAVFYNIESLYRSLFVLQKFAKQGTDHCKNVYRIAVQRLSKNFPKRCRVFILLLLIKIKAYDASSSRECFNNNWYWHDWHSWKNNQKMFYLIITHANNTKPKRKLDLISIMINMFWHLQCN